MPTVPATPARIAAAAIAIAPLVLLVGVATLSEHGPGAATLFAAVALGTVVARLTWLATRSWRRATWPRSVAGWGLPAAAAFAVLPATVVGLRARGALAPHDAELASWILGPWALAGLAAAALLFGVGMAQSSVRGATVARPGDVARGALAVACVALSLAVFAGEMLRDTSIAEPRSTAEAQRALPGLRAEAALRRRNAHVRWLVGLAESYTHDEDRALTDLAAAERLDPSDASPHNTIGWIYLKRRDYERAIPELKQAVSLDDRYVAALENLGFAYMETHRDGDAAAAFSRAIAIDPSDAYALREYATSLYRLGKWSVATVYARRAVAAGSTDAGAHALLGFLVRSHADFAGARREYAKAAALEPRAARWWAELALTDALMGHRDSALAAIARAESLDSSLVATDPRFVELRRSLQSSTSFPAALAGVPR